MLNLFKLVITNKYAMLLQQDDFICTDDLLSTLECKFSSCLNCFMKHNVVLPHLIHVLNVIWQELGGSNFS
jgi:hypothetical protein